MTKINKTLNLPKHDLNALTGWDDLEASEQTKIKQETIALDKALLTAGNARLAIGEHLFNVQQILEPKRIFTAYVLSQTAFSRATAYRYIDIYTAAKTILPAPVLRVAMLRGSDRLNVKLMEATPPPRTNNVVKINEYLDSMEKSGPRLVETASPDASKKDCYNYVHLRFQRLPNSHKTRSAWIHSLAGMLLAELGVSGTQTIEPVAIPDGYKAVRGRPRVKKVAA